MKVALAFPPFCDPRAPQLALPSLAAYLRRAGVAVSLHDLNLESILDLCTEERLARTHAALVCRADARPSPEAARAVISSERLIETADWALSVLRDPERFVDPVLHAAARGVVDDVLRTAALAAGGLDVGLLPIRYRAKGLGTASLAHLIAATGRPALDLFGETSEAFLARMRGPRPLLVGVTITNRQQILPGLTLARRLRSDGHFVVIGGAVFSKFRDELAACPGFFEVFADAVVVYEGETALLGLVEALTTSGELAAVPNLLFRDRGRLIATPTHVEDVAVLPTPDFAGLPLDHYLAPYPVLPILTGKGCYFNRCKFCDIPFINHISRKAYRVRPAEQVVADVHTLASRYGAKHFVITDEALSPKLLAQLADGFELRPGSFTFTGYARPEPGFTAEACQRFAGFGLRKLFFGIESGSQATLDHMDKGVQIDRVPQVLANCRQAGIDFHLFNIVGLPEETAEEARKTLRFLLDNKAVIDSPGSSFDIHPFGLELRTRYFSERGAHRIVVRPEALEKEFVIGLDEGDWENGAGLSPEEARQLIDSEFAPRLRRTFRTWHAGPDPLWPPQEEYSVIYADAYGGSAFLWRSALPEGASARFSFVLSPTVRREAGAVTLYQLASMFRLPEGLMQMLSSGGTLTWAEHMSAWPDAPTSEAAREYVEALIELGLLVIRLPAAVQVGLER